VAIHAADLAGDIKGKNCLVFGAGPLGLLMVHVLKLRGAAFVAVSDITQPRLARAAKFEPSMIIDAGADPDYTTLKGMSIDICVELAGGSSPALAKAILTVRRGGLVLQVAQRPPTEVICAQLIFGEKRIQGVFGQTGRNFDQALEMLGNGTTPGNLLLTDFYTLDNIQQAFDRVRSPEALKVIVRPG
jgi:L-idonate 5-dehydrogenase